MSLSELESRSIYILRECAAQFRNPIVMWSTRKGNTTILQHKLAKECGFEASEQFINEKTELLGREEVD